MTWKVKSYLSGTVIVQDTEAPSIWYYVYGPSLEEENESDKVRHEYAYLLRDFLNGGSTPAFLRDMLMDAEGSSLIGADGTRIHATGPMYDAAPPKLCWKQKEDRVSRKQRRALIENINVL